MEDVDLGFRLRLAGWGCLLVPDAIAAHVGSASSGGAHSDFAVYHGHRNLVWCFVKNMPALLLGLFLLPHLMLNLVSIVVFACRGQLRTILRAKMDALRGIPAVLRQRKVLQSGQCVSSYAVWRVLCCQVFPQSKT